MKAMAAHLKSFAAELCVSAITGILIYGMTIAVLISAGIDRTVAQLLSLSYAIPFPFFVLLLKTVFPKMAPHRSYTPTAYVILSQIIAATITATILEAMGEDWSQSGNIRDVVLYALLLGTPSGLLYAFFSKIISKDVDTSGAGV